jgi:ribosomal protein S18 acetylase RimI-like enzyme
MLNLRRANIADHKFLVRIDLKDEGVSSIIQHEEKIHNEKILKYLIDQDKGAFIIEDTDTGKQIGMIMYTITNRDLVYPWKTIFNEIDRTLFQSDGRFMEIFQLWIHSNYRRIGLATKLKEKLEEEAKYHKVSLIYTHTEESNNHVIELNKKIGYHEVRRGPIWDDVIRVSLIKQLN